MPSDIDQYDLALLLRVELALHNQRPGKVAERAGLHPSVMSRVLRGKQQPGPSTFRRIRQAVQGG